MTRQTDRVCSPGKHGSQLGLMVELFTKATGKMTSLMVRGCTDLETEIFMLDFMMMAIIMVLVDL